MLSDLDVAHDWFADNRSRGWATCPLTENGFVRTAAALARSRQPIGVALLVDGVADKLDMEFTVGRERSNGTIDIWGGTIVAAHCVQRDSHEAQSSTLITWRPRYCPHCGQTV